MSGDYHITRAAQWTESKNNPITKWEWQDYAHNDPELTSDPENGPCSFIWSAHPDGSDSWWLDWLNGQVYASDPDAAFVDKLVKIAEALKARVLDQQNTPVGPEQEAEPEQRPSVG